MAPILPLAGLSVSLSIDAVAVSLARGIALQRPQAKHILSVCLYFGGAQAIMPLVGFELAKALGAWVANWERWLAVLLLFTLGGRNILNSIKKALLNKAKSPLPPPSSPSSWSPSAMLPLALATSLDAFAVGVALPTLDIPILWASLTIGVVTALFSALGL
ncbi:MAG: manganese efflux pump, partial [Sandaracinaceae bacterium]|nr:manganese efflux pump [Sandaracinaceae bacterium]